MARNGVMPVPPAISRSGTVGSGGSVRSPCAWLSSTMSPGRKRSCTQPVTRPPGWRPIVRLSCMSSSAPVSENVRARRRPSTSTVSTTCWPARKPRQAPFGRSMTVRARGVSHRTASTRASTPRTAKRGSAWRTQNSRALVETNRVSEPPSIEGPFSERPYTDPIQPSGTLSQHLFTDCCYPILTN